MKDKLTPTYWDNRYTSNDFPWDLGAVSPPIKSFVDTLDDKSLKILVPGAGSGYEAAYLFEQGFEHTYICEWASAAAHRFLATHEDFPSTQMLVQDFFTLEGKFDLILEQTFFCAINPNKREDYARKVHSLLKENGRLCGLLFNVDFGKEGPPFGGNKADYHSLFTKYFSKVNLVVATNSVTPRLGSELWIELIK